jgi:hypothetical protein
MENAKLNLNAVVFGPSEGKWGGSARVRGEGMCHVFVSLVGIMPPEGGQRAHREIEGGDAVEDR